MRDDLARDVADDTAHDLSSDVPYDVSYIQDLVVDALARGESIDAHALTLLLRRYRMTACHDLGDLVGLALASALEAAPPASGDRPDDATPWSAPVVERAAWLALFVEASAASDDERVAAAIERLARDLRGAWASASVEQSSAAIGACLEAARLDACRALAADAIDELERLIGAAYEPGAGVGGFADQVRTASALLTAYSLSGRLPYSMLAEELMQRAGRAEVADFAASCDAARVYCRLAMLHDDAEYCAAAVVAPDADYRGDAQRLLARHADEARRRGVAGAIYGVALLELESAQSSIHHSQP